MVFTPVAHDLKRKQALATGRITDNAGRLTATLVDQFDLSHTIFKTLPPRSLPALFARTKIDMHYTFDPRLAAEIEKSYSRVPRPVADDSAIFKFMHEECDFSIEHADGSFLDHLHFCHEYAARYYTTASSSPRVLLLHSIMGVGTNCFPMTLEKVPMLKSLVSEKDFTQLEAFPSILRLLIHGYLLNELAACDATELARLRAIRFHSACAHGLGTNARRAASSWSYRLALPGATPSLLFTLLCNVVRLIRVRTAGQRATDTHRSAALREPQLPDDPRHRLSAARLMEAHEWHILLQHLRAAAVDPRPCRAAVRARRIRPR